MNKGKTVYKAAEYFSMAPEDLIAELEKTFPIEIPVVIDSVKEMERAGALLGQYASVYSYLMSMALKAKLIKRGLKQKHADRTVTEDALSREEIFSQYAEAVKMAYNAISRMFTVKQQINDEIKMNRFVV